MAPAFCSVVRLELKEYKGVLSFEQEHNLGRMPLRIDFLVIKKEPGAVVDNGICDFFLGSNLFEYKSPGNEMNAGEGLDMDLTATLFREGRPVKLINQLGEKYQVARTGRGIYRIGGLPFPVQIIAGRKLDRREYAWLTSLTREMDRKQAELLLESTLRLKDEEDRRNAASVMNVASEANLSLFRKMIQEGREMCEELKELLAPEIVEYKMQLADNAARLADKDAEIAMLKKMLAEAGLA